MDTHYVSTHLCMVACIAHVTVSASFNLLKQKNITRSKCPHIAKGELVKSSCQVGQSTPAPAQEEFFTSGIWEGYLRHGICRSSMAVRFTAPKDISTSPLLWPASGVGMTEDPAFSYCSGNEGNRVALPWLLGCRSLCVFIALLLPSAIGKKEEKKKKVERLKSKAGHLGVQQKYQRREKRGNNHGTTSLKETWTHKQKNLDQYQETCQQEKCKWVKFALICALGGKLIDWTQDTLAKLPPPLQ